MMTNLEKQDLRHAVLGLLVRRRGPAFSAGQIAAGLRREIAFDFDAHDVSDACRFLDDMDECEMIPDPYGAEQLWRANAKGMLAHERRQTETV